MMYSVLIYSNLRTHESTVSCSRRHRSSLFFLLSLSLIIEHDIHSHAEKERSEHPFASPIVAIRQASLGMPAIAEGQGYTAISWRALTGDPCPWPKQHQYMG